VQRVGERNQVVEKERACSVDKPSRGKDNIREKDPGRTTKGSQKEGNREKTQGNQSQREKDGRESCKGGREQVEDTIRAFHNGRGPIDRQAVQLRTKNERKGPVKREGGGGGKSIGRNFSICAGQNHQKRLLHSPLGGGFARMKRVERWGKDTRRSGYGNGKKIFKVVSRKRQIQEKGQGEKRGREEGRLKGKMLRKKKKWDIL